jgi:hypothetical protein
MYVSREYQMNSAKEVASMIAKFDKDEPTWYNILMIDYFYHNHEVNYDGGLSFLDRLNKKIGHLHPDWNIEELKTTIRNANNPVAVYSDIVEYMLGEARDLLLYGF